MDNVTVSSDFKNNVTVSSDFKNVVTIPPCFPTALSLWHYRFSIIALKCASKTHFLTRALLGWAFERPPPLRFFEDSEKTAGFHPPYPPSFPQLLWKFRPNAMWGQVTRSGQVTQLQNNFPIAPRLQCFRESYEPFRIWWAHQCLQNVYLWFLISVTSGPVIFATSPL